MQGVPYPVYGEDNLGYSQMMQPGENYTFPGQYVTEYPQIAKYGGGLLNKTLTCPKCGWSWKAVDGGKDIATCHKCGGTAKLAYGGLHKAQKGEQIEDNDSWLENIAEIVDPTGISSWDDVYRAYKNTGLSGETVLEALGAIPLLGKIGKSGKVIAGGFGLLQDAVKASKYLPTSKQQKFIDKAFDTYQKYNKAGGKELDEALGSTTKILKDKIPYINPTKWSSSDKAINVANKAFKTGRISDAVQAALGSKDNSGFTWDMRHGEVPMYNGRNIFPQIQLGEHGDFAYGGDPSLSDITGHYPFGGQNSKTGTHFEEGGWLDAYDEEYRRGGMVNPLMKSRSKRSGTSKNIQSSINKIFLRNRDIFGPGGKNIYDPKSKYQDGGGWLAEYQNAGQLRAASSTGAIPVSTQAPVNPTNATNFDWVAEKWKNRDQGPSDWNFAMMDKSGSYVDSGIDPFSLMLPVQAVSGAKAAMTAKNIKAGTPKSLKVSQAPRKSYQDLTIRDKVINPSKPITSIPEELQPYISRTNPDFFKLYDKNLSKTEMEKKLLENTTFFDRKGNVIPAPENLKKTGGQSGWLDKYNNF
jgi:hypothetical protein